MMSRFSALAVWALGSTAVALAGLLLLLVLVQPAAARCDGNGRCNLCCLEQDPGLGCHDVVHNAAACSQVGGDACCNTCHCNLIPGPPPVCGCQ
jgi:hypothetical protein